MEAQDLAELVALVQNFELVNKGCGAVSFEAFISAKKIHHKCILLHVTALFLDYRTEKRNTHPFLVVAIPTSVSLIPTPEK